MKLVIEIDIGWLLFVFKIKLGQRSPFFDRSEFSVLLIRLLILQVARQQLLHTDGVKQEVAAFFALLIPQLLGYKNDMSTSAGQSRTC